MESIEREDYYGLERMRHLGISRGSGRLTTLRGKERRAFNQFVTGTISMGTLAAEDGMEHTWECPECCDVSS